MLPLTRGEIEVLLDAPDRSDYVVSAFADLTVQNGFERHVDLHLKNQAKAAGDALAASRARRSLDENLEVVREAVRTADPRARGLAVFSGAARGFKKVLALDFPVDNRLVVDEEPFVLPILEHWYADPRYLIALVDSDEAHLFEARHGHPDRVRDVVRDDVGQDIQRDKPRFIYKKRFGQAFHERLMGMEDDKYLKSVAEAVRDHWGQHDFDGLILLGQSQITGPLRRLLPREVAEAVVTEANHAMTTDPDQLARDVSPMLHEVRLIREQRTLAELRERVKEKHLVALGATDVLDALQQGRATEVLIGNRTDIPGSRCTGCNYRLGAAVRNCPYCGAETRAVNAVQDILVMAMRHRVPVQIVRRPSAKEDPLAPANDVAALLRAEANWAPDPAAAAASEGHAPAGGG